MDQTLLVPENSENNEAKANSESDNTLLCCSFYEKNKYLMNSDTFLYN